MTETGDRAAFLATARRALSDAPAFGHARPIAPLAGGVVAPIAYAHAVDPDDVDGLIDAFSTALASVGGVARRIDDEDGRAAFIADALVAANAARAVVTNERECDGVRELVADHDVELVDYDDAAAVATCDVGITGARAAIALTGSIVVDAGRAGGRTVSLLPPLHLAFVRADAIVATPGDLWRSMAAPMPSNLVQVTGPSRSADIELVITLGVHGPRALWVGVLT